MIKVYKVEDLECAHCAAKMEEAISKLPGVNGATVSFFAQKITVDFDDEISSTIDKNVAGICRKIEPDCKVIL